MRVTVDAWVILLDIDHGDILSPAYPGSGDRAGGRRAALGIGQHFADGDQRAIGQLNGKIWHKRLMIERPVKRFLANLKEPLFFDLLFYFFLIYLPLRLGLRLDLIFRSSNQFLEFFFIGLPDPGWIEETMLTTEDHAFHFALRDAVAKDRRRFEEKPLGLPHAPIEDGPDQQTRRLLMALLAVGVAVLIVMSFAAWEFRNYAMRSPQMAPISSRQDVGLPASDAQKTAGAAQINLPPTAHHSETQNLDLCGASQDRRAKLASFYLLSRRRVRESPAHLPTGFGDRPCQSPRLRRRRKVTIPKPGWRGRHPGSYNAGKYLPRILKPFPRSTQTEKMQGPVKGRGVAHLQG